MRTDNALNLFTGLNVVFKNSSPLLYMSFLTAAAEKRLFFWCLLGSSFEPERLLFYYFIGKSVLPTCHLLPGKNGSLRSNNSRIIFNSFEAVTAPYYWNHAKIFNATRQSTIRVVENGIASNQIDFETQKDIYPETCACIFNPKTSSVVLARGNVCIMLPTHLIDGTLSSMLYFNSLSSLL